MYMSFINLKPSNRVDIDTGLCTESDIYVFHTFSPHPLRKHLVEVDWARLITQVTNFLNSQFSD